MSKPGTGYEIAVIGMAGRFPKARNIHEYWNNLVNGVGSVVFFTDEELETAGIDPSLYRDKSYVRAKAYLEDAENFDADFFDYARDEARIMDPQVRLLHETTYEAIEDAGYNPYDYKGAIGFYAGAFYNHYWEAVAAPLADASRDKFEVVHLIDKDFLNSRVSYKLNLKGPSVSVSTACSTSLASIHLACRALLTGECNIALAGGVTLYLPQKAGYLRREPTNFSRDGMCRPFDARATGFLPGEGVGMVALKLLTAAAADGDHIYAVIKGSAINNDGANKAGYAAPGIDGPVNAMKAALRFSRVEPESVGYIEAHGTGTYLGDQLEFEALRAGYASGNKGHCRIGSHKANIGYLGPASGVAGFIKTALTLYHKKIPPLLNFEEPNPCINAADSPFLFDNRMHEWNGNGHPLRAAVNNISVGGTNVHVILEEAPEKEQQGTEPGYSIIPLSARFPAALEAVTMNMGDYLQKHPDVNLRDVAYTLQTGRKAFEYRRSFVCSTGREAVENLVTLRPDRVKTFEAVREGRPVYFLFSGQEDIEPSGILEFYEKEEAIRNEIDSCLALKEKTAGGGPGAPFSKDRIDELEREQPLVLRFITQHALARYLVLLNIRPDGMMGYGDGEYAAACIAGVLSPADALRAVAARDAMVKKMPRTGSLKVSLARDQLLPLMEAEVSIEYELSSAKCVVSGALPGLEHFSAVLKERGHRATRMDMSSSSAACVTPALLQEFAGALQGIPLNKPVIPCLSSLTGAWMNADDADSGRYWLDQATKTLNVKDGIAELVGKPDAVFVEIGTGRSFAPLLQQHERKTKSQSVLNILKGPKDTGSSVAYLLDKIGKLWGEGMAIDWGKLYGREKARHVPLPTYPFQKQRFPVPVLRSRP